MRPLMLEHENIRPHIFKLNRGKQIGIPKRALIHRGKRNNFSRKKNSLARRKDSKEWFKLHKKVYLSKRHFSVHASLSISRSCFKL